MFYPSFGTLSNYRKFVEFRPRPFEQSLFLFVLKGDVMLNPPWWMHAIKNTSEKSAAVATRWLTGGLV